MARSTLRQRIQYWMQRIPFTPNTVVLTVAGWAAYRLLRHSRTTGEEAETGLRAFILLMGEMVAWFVLALVVLSVLSTLAAWIHYLMQRRREGSGLAVAFANEGAGARQRLFLEATLPGAHRPLLGFVKGRLFYDDYRLTDTFPLLSNKRRRGRVWRDAIWGRSRLALPDVKEYELRGGFVYFEDMLRLLSLPVKEKLSGHFYQPPTAVLPPEDEVAPKKTETLDVRIDQMRRVEGEYLAYKSFESGDDVRRIVWKVYARNRELVVRNPERFEPYASHLYFYASFGVRKGYNFLEEGYGREMLNWYKARVWSVYGALAKKEFQLRYIPDQKLALPEGLSAEDLALRTVSNSAFTTAAPLSSYFNPRQGAVLTVHSLTDPNDLRAMLDAADSSTVVYFVKLSRTFKSFVAWGWMKRILLRPPKDRLARLRSRWLFSGARGAVRKAEKEIEAVLAESSVTYGVI